MGTLRWWALALLGAALVSPTLVSPALASPALASPAQVSPAPASPAQAGRRPFAPSRGGQPVIEGISYGPFREGQAPGGPLPSEAQILEDLQILAPRWGMVRVYSSRGATPLILKVIRANTLPIQVLLGAWIAPDKPAENAAEVAGAIALANAYPRIVVGVSVGNESQVDWSAHRSPLAPLVAHIKAVRAAVKQPVTTADDYNFWNKPRSKAVAAEVDFLLLHAYAMWNGKALGEAVPWTAQVVADIRRHHPGLPIVMGETGWATALNPQGDERKHIKAPAGEAEQARFHREFTAWALKAKLPHFYFEAFDEPWKGSADPREVEKHWGLYDVHRKPKQALQGTPEGATP